ncbi:MAG TPA: sigma-70 family RNA polymerase sigma factor [Puia sp.]|jgi:RNA polymerase sigma-70 factor (ECF subfamily)
MIAALKNGDHTAFTEAYDLYHKKVYYLVLSRTNSAYLAEETTQLTFIKLWQYRRRLTDTLSLDIQLFRIAKTTLIDLLRKESYRAKCSREKKKGSMPVDPSSALQQKQLLGQLAGLVDQMPPMRRKVFQLSRYEGLSYREIAQKLSLSVKTVENHMALAIRELRPLLFLLSFFLIQTKF